MMRRLTANVLCTALIGCLWLACVSCSEAAGEPAKGNIVDCESMARLTATYEDLKFTAEHFVAQQQQLKALACYEAAAANSAKYGPAWSDLGNLQSKLGRMGDAAASFEKCIKWVPQYFGCYVNLANVQRERKEYLQAEMNFQRALQLDSTSHATLNNLGILQYERGRLQDAFQTFQRALDLDPNSAEAHYNIGNILRDHGNLEDAVKKYGVALSLNPSDPRSRLNMGICLSELGRNVDALEVFQQLLRSDQQSYAPDTYYNVAIALLRMGRLQEARLSFLKALSLTSKNDARKQSDTMANVARVDAVLGRWEHSRSGFERAWNADTTNVGILSEYVASKLATVDVAGLDALVKKLLETASDEYTPKYDKHKKEWRTKPSVSVRPTELMLLTDDGVLLKNGSAKFEAALASRIRKLSILPYSEVSHLAYPEFDPAERPLRIAVVSNNFNHSLLPFDIAKLRIDCWHRHRSSERAPFCSSLTTLSPYSFQDAAERLNQAGYDVILLLDLPANDEFAAQIAFLHPSPVQVSWNSWAATSGGGSAADFSVVFDDQLWSKDISMLNRTFGEKLIALPRPVVSPRSAVSISMMDFAQPIVVGIVNPNRRFWSPSFLSDHVLPVLTRHPSAHLLVAASGTETAQDLQRLRKYFAEHGISSDRIQQAESAMEVAQTASICLDTFPVHSPAHTRIALEHGCTVVSRTGNSTYSRASLPLLVGHAESTAVQTSSDYVAAVSSVVEQLRSVDGAIRRSVEFDFSLSVEAFAMALVRARQEFANKPAGPRSHIFLQ